MQSTHPIHSAFVIIVSAILLLAACMPIQTSTSVTIPQILIVQGNHTLENNEAKSAGTAFTHSLRLEPLKAEGYLHRAEAHYEEGNYEEAIADVNQALELNPGDPYVFALRSKVYQALGQFDEAKTDFERAVY